MGPRWWPPLLPAPTCCLHLNDKSHRDCSLAAAAGYAGRPTRQMTAWKTSVKVLHWDQCKIILLSSQTAVIQKAIWISRKNMIFDLLFSIYWCRQNIFKYINKYCFKKKPGERMSLVGRSMDEVSVPTVTSQIPWVRSEKWGHFLIFHWLTPAV